MKAKDLIAILEKKPEQEIKLYNNFIGDWADISIEECELVKTKDSTLLEQINYQNKREGLPIWDTLQEGKYQKRDWELKNRFIDYVKNKSCYHFKKVFLIQWIKRNKQTFDRLGNIEY